MKSIEELIEATSQYIEARDEYDRMDGPSGRQFDNMAFAYDRMKKALKSALETPPALPPAEEWPQWFRFPQGDLFKFDGPGDLGARWSWDFQQWGSHGKAYGLKEIQLYLGAVPIPAAEALAIIEKSK